MREKLIWPLKATINWVKHYFSPHTAQPVPSATAQPIQPLDFQAIFEATPSNYLILDTAFHIIMVNEAYLKVTNTNRNIIGHYLFEVFPDNLADTTSKVGDNLGASLKRVLTTGKRDIMAVQKYDILLPDGSGFEVRYWRPINTPVLNKNGEVIYIIHRIEDVTPLMTANNKLASLDKSIEKQANELYLILQELKCAKEAAEKANHFKTIFFNNVTHEFRTPLTLILGHIENLLHTIQKNMLSEQQHEYLKSAHWNALRLLKLVNSLLDFASLEANHVEAFYESVNLSQITAELLSAFSSKIEKSDIIYHVNMLPLSQEVYVDRDMWEKLVLNLLSNAFKYTKAGKITIELKEINGFAELSVSDTGIGISEKDLPYIFERFYTGENTKGRSVEGIGIGLSLAKEIVTLHRSRITVNSVVGKGTTFTVQIPFGTAHLPQEKIRPKNESCQRNRSMEAYKEEVSTWLSSRSQIEDILTEKNIPRILIMDDNKDMCQLISNYLSSNFQLIFAEDGKVALTKARTYKPDLILTDINMPAMNGFELLKAIREDEKLHKTPVIMLSAHTDEEVLVEGLQASANDYLSKPFSAKVLLARIHTQLELKNLREQRDREDRDKFIDSVCHEVRNPLAVIKGSTDLLKEKLIHFALMIESGYFTQDVLTVFSDIQELVANIMLSAELQKNIVDKVLTLSKLENNPDALEISHFNLKDIIRDTMSMLKLQASQKNILLNVEVPDEEIEIRSDSTRLREILINLVGNAIKFTSKGSITLKLNDPKIEHPEQLTTLHFTVEDMGSGMDAEEMKLLFNCFSQSLSQNPNPNHTGLGLGLAICKQIVMSLGGNIWVESKKAQGSQLHFTICAQTKLLPKIMPASSIHEVLPDQVKQKLPPLSPHIPLNILVVDDNAMARKVLMTSLKQAGYDRCEMATNGQEAVNCFKEKTFDIIFMDMKMPIMGGIEATEKIRQIEREKNLVPAVIIGISGDARDIHAAHAIKRGMNDYFTKPYRKGKLFEEIAQVAQFKKLFSLNSSSSLPDESFWITPTHTRERLVLPIKEMRQNDDSPSTLNFAQN